MVFLENYEENGRNMKKYDEKLEKYEKNRFSDEFFI